MDSQKADLLACRCFPEPNCCVPIYSPRYDGLAIRREGNGRSPASMDSQKADLLACRCYPEPNGCIPIYSPQYDGLAIRREGHGANTDSMPNKLPNRLARRYIPQINHVPAGRCHETPVRREGHGIDVVVLLVGQADQIPRRTLSPPGCALPPLQI